MARFAVELHLGTQIGRPVLDDGEPQSRAAGGMALVHPVKPLEYPALGLPGNADACVRHRDPGAEGGIFHRDGDAAVRPVVGDGVVAEVVDCLLYTSPSPRDA